MKFTNSNKQLTVLRWMKRQDNGDTIALFAASNNDGE